MKTLLVSALLLAVMTLGGTKLKADETARQISVNGEAVVKVAPDEIILTVGLESTDPNLIDAKNKNDQLTGKLIQICTDQNIPKKHIQTDYINIRPVYDDYRLQKNFLYYQVRKTAVITIKDMEIFEPLLTDLIGVGIDNVIGIDFRTTDLCNLKDQARSMALLAAKEKAEAMALNLDQKIGQVISIRENHSGSWSWYGSSWYGYRDNYMSQNVSQNVGGGEYTGESLAPGQIAIRANVSVTFALQ